MPGKHPTNLPFRRYGLIAGAATLLVVLVSWVAVRASGPVQPEQRVPLMVQPTMPLGAPGPTVIPWGRRSATPSLSATPAPATTKPTGRKPATRRVTTTPVGIRKPTKKPAPTRTTSAPTPAANLTARYSTGASWDQGFIGAVEVTNTSGTARTWTVKVTYASRAGVRVGNTWNAQVSRQGDTFVFTGGPLAPGATVSMGYEAAKQVRGPVQPSGCTVDGASCRMG